MGNQELATTEAKHLTKYTEKKTAQQLRHLKLGYGTATGKVRQAKIENELQ